MYFEIYSICMNHLLLQVNFGVNSAALLGIIYILLAIIYFIFMIAWLIPRANRIAPSALTLYIIQLIITPILLLLSGFILMFQGWRLDPILQLSQFLLFLVIIYLGIKDIVINVVYKDRQ